MKKLLYAVVALTALFCVCASARNTPSQVMRDLNVFNSVVKELNVGYVDTLDSETLVRRAIDAMLAQVDPYTQYYPASKREDLTSISSGQYGGIGAYISRRPDGSIYISEPVYGAPAWQAGLRHGDRILAVDGVAVTDIKEADGVSRRLRGTPGTTVRVDLQRPWVSDSLLTVTIERRTIHQSPMPLAEVDSAGVGYIRLVTFNENSAPLVRQALEEMLRRPEPLQGLVLDLRSNGGGVLEGAVQIVELFLPKGTEVVRTRGAEGRDIKTYKTTRQPIAPSLPLAVLTDGNTASASEIVAGALQDLDRAVIIGDRSYGKGLVQSSRPLPQNGLLKLTVARYYIPSGRLIQALDYSHRNPDGSPARVPDSLTRTWATAHGRTVRDGGGITPDIAMGDTTYSQLEYSLDANEVFFNFANRYRATHDSLPPVAQWQVTDSLFEEFKAFVDPSKFKYKQMTQKGLEYLRECVRYEGFDNDSVTREIDRLAAMLKRDLTHDLEFNRPRLTERLDIEIAERYYDEADQLRVFQRYDAELDTARAVLLDQPRYRRILNIK